MTPHLRLAFATLLGFNIILLSAAAAPPQVTKVTAPSLQTGATVTLIIDGTDLMPNPRVLLPVPIAAQVIKDGATDKRVQVEVRLDPTVPPGVYPLRVASDKGVSGATVVEIDEQPPQPFAPQTAKLPAFLQGALGGSATLATSFAGTKGQRLVFEVEARRLGSAIDPVIKLLNAQRVQIAWAQGSNALAGDTRLTTVLPADGTYTLELHDLQYKAGNPNRFRLRIGDYPHADLAFPLAGRRGGKASFQLTGNLPAGTRAELDLTALPAGAIVPLPRVAGMVGLPPRILVSDIPEVMESEPADKPQEVTAPVAINGRIRKAGAEGRYRIAVEPGTKLRFDVLAERAGSLLDGVLVLRNDAGLQLARSDDQPGTLDPGLEFTVPAGVTSLIAVVSDANGRGGPNYVYRLAVTPTTLPDFSLALVEDSAPLPPGGAAVVRVRAVRSNYTGPIKLTLPGLPEGVTVTGDEIPAGATETLLSFTAPEGAKLSQAVLQVSGDSSEPGTALKRLALLPETPLSRSLPVLRSELVVAVTEPEPIAVSWEEAEAGLPIGGKTAAKVKVTRAATAKGAIRLALLTSQVIPKGKDGKDDVNRTLRLEAPVMIADQGTSELKIVVPGDLPPMPYDVAIRAELLAADGKKVVLAAVTPARRLLAAK